MPKVKKKVQNAQGEDPMNQPTIALVGMGIVGSTVAHTLTLSIPGITLLLVDINNNKCEGEEQDLDDAVALLNSSKIISGTLQEAAQADIIVIMAGIAQKTGQTRLELLETNKKIMTDIIHKMGPLQPSTIIIVVTNPVDILTLHVQELTQLPRNQIFGSGTLLDTIRLKELLSEKLAINPTSLNINVLGEHGDSQFVAWSTATIDGTPLESVRQFTTTEKKLMEDQTAHKAYDIIACKGSTSFGIAACIEIYCQAILYDKKSIVPVSCYQTEYALCLSMPVILGKNGIKQMITINLNKEERTKLEQSVAALKSVL